jgi:hypothetical protein
MKSKELAMTDTSSRLPDSSRPPALRGGAAQGAYGVGLEISRRRVLSLAAERLCHGVRTLPPALSRAKGEESERLLREFLSSFLPKRFAVGKGYVVDRGETLSYETDVVIYDALHSAVYPLTPTVVMVPAGGVAATIEVKARLYGGYLREEVAKARLLKRLEHPVPFVGLLAFGNKNPLQRVASEYTRLIRDYGPGGGFDAVAVLDQGLVTPARAADPTDGLVCVDPIGLDTLAAFLRLLLAHLARFPATFGDPALAQGPTE